MAAMLYYTSYIHTRCRCRVACVWVCSCRGSPLPAHVFIRAVLLHIYCNLTLHQAHHLQVATSCILLLRARFALGDQLAYSVSRTSVRIGADAYYHAFCSMHMGVFGLVCSIQCTCSNTRFFLFLCWYF